VAGGGYVLACERGARVCDIYLQIAPQQWTPAKQPTSTHPPAHATNQMSVSTARWLSSKEGFSRHPSPTPHALSQPSTAAYLAAALLTTMLRYDGRARSERFAVLAFHAGADAARSTCRRWRQQERFVGGSSEDEEESAWLGADDGDDDDDDDGCDGDDKGCSVGEEEGEGGVVGAVCGAKGRMGLLDATRDAGAPRGCGGCGRDQQQHAQHTTTTTSNNQQQQRAREHGDLASYWQRYLRARGLVEQLAHALELRRGAATAAKDPCVAARDGGESWAAGGGGGGCGMGGSMMHLVHAGETLKRIAAITGTTGECVWVCGRGAWACASAFGSEERSCREGGGQCGVEFRLSSHQPTLATQLNPPNQPKHTHTQSPIYLPPTQTSPMSHPSNPTTSSRSPYPPSSPASTPCARATASDPSVRHTASPSAACWRATRSCQTRGGCSRALCWWCRG